MDDQPNLKKLNDLINSLEMKEAIENGDMGVINYKLKRITMMIQDLTTLHGEDKSLQNKILDSNLQQNKNTAKVLCLTQEHFFRFEKLISNLSKRVSVLEEEKQENL